MKKDLRKEGIKNIFYDKKTITFNVPLFHKEAISVPVESASFTELISEAKTLKKGRKLMTIQCQFFGRKSASRLL